MLLLLPLLLLNAARDTAQRISRCTTKGDAQRTKGGKTGSSEPSLSSLRWKEILERWFNPLVAPPLPSAARLSVKEFGASRPQSRLLITVRCCCVCPGFRGATHRRKEVEAVAFRAFSFARRLSFEMDERRNVGKAWKKKKL